MNTGAEIESFVKELENQNSENPQKEEVKVEINNEQIIQ